MSGQFESERCYETVLEEIRHLQESHEVWGHGTSLEKARTINAKGFETMYDGLNRTAVCLPEDPSLLKIDLEEWPFSDCFEAIVLIFIPKTEGVDYSKWKENYGWCVIHRQYMTWVEEKSTNRLNDEYLYGYLDTRTGKLIRHIS